MRLTLLYGIIITSGKAREGKEVVSWKHQQAAFRARTWAPLTKCARSTRGRWTW